MAARSFTADVAAFAQKAEGLMQEAFQEAVRLVDQEAAQPESEGGHLPVVSGRLRRSRAASTIAMPPILWRQDDFNGSDAAIVAVIETATIGQTVYIGFQAPYAQKVEDKHGMVRLAAQRWPQIVEQAIRNVQARSG